MQNVRWLNYPWLAMPGVLSKLRVDASTPDGRMWSSGGILSVPEGATVHVLGQNGRACHLPEGDWRIALPEKKDPIRIRVTFGAQTEEFALEPPGSMAWLTERQNCRSLPLYQTVLSWASFFDECLVDEKGEEKHDDGREGMALSWADIDEKLRNALAHPDEPQMSLIVRIAESLSKTIEDFDRGIRRVLARDRRMMPADKAEEFDAASIDWYIRQPGLTAAEKAAYNQQRLKAVARKEFVDTLENRVLKDFLRRCTQEAEGYRLLCTESQKRSRRARTVQKFGLLCRMLLSSPVFESIATIQGIVQPNYVLQGDPRYRKVWRFYKLLLRKQRAADFLWAWQARLWGDIVAVTLNVALWRMAQKTDADLTLSPIAESGPDLSFEQHEGRRFSDTSDAGPWLLRQRDASLSSGQVVEVVSSAKMAAFLANNPAWGGYGQNEKLALQMIREALVVFLTPLDSMRPRRALIVWPLHSEADNRIDHTNIRETLAVAQELIEARAFPGTLSVQGLVVASDHSSGFIPQEIEPVTVVSFGSHPAQWAKNLDGLDAWLTRFFEEALR